MVDLKDIYGNGIRDAEEWDVFRVSFLNFKLKLSNKILTGESRLTSAMVIVNQIDARGAMLTLSDAIVDVLVAVLPHPAHSAFAVVVADQVGAGHGVDARVLVLTFVGI